MSTPNPVTGNLSRERLGACIERIKAHLAHAEIALTEAQARNIAATQLIAIDAEWTAQDAIYADPTYVEGFAESVAWNTERLQMHLALYKETHGEDYAEPSPSMVLPEVAKAKQIKAIEQYRAQLGHRDGFVIVWRGNIVGTCAVLGFPSSWAPGCLAVDPDGRMHVSMGGDLQGGAKMWRPVTADAKAEQAEFKEIAHAAGLSGFAIDDQAASALLGIGLDSEDNGEAA